jgi:hypothetical protein
MLTLGLRVAVQEAAAYKQDGQSARPIGEKVFGSMAALIAHILAMQPGSQLMEPSTFPPCLSLRSPERISTKTSNNGLKN